MERAGKYGARINISRHVKRLAVIVLLAIMVILVRNAYSGEREHRFWTNVNTWFACCAGGWFLLQVFTLSQVFFVFRMESPVNSMV